MDQLVTRDEKFDNVIQKRAGTTFNNHGKTKLEHQQESVVFIVRRQVTYTL